VNSNYPEAAARASHRCEYCRAPEAAFNFPFEVEHVVPGGLGGADEMSNLALACRSCNVHKSNRLDAIDPVGGERARLFNPRADTWDAHFSVDEEERIVGTTAIGRATVDALHMNSAPQLEARRWWRRLRLFP
jgi:hypothetical protein